MPNQPSPSPARSVRRLWWSQPSRRNGTGKGQHNLWFSAPACLRLASPAGRRLRLCSTMEVILLNHEGLVPEQSSKEMPHIAKMGLYDEPVQAHLAKTQSFILRSI